MLLIPSRSGLFGLTGLLTLSSLFKTPFFLPPLHKILRGGRKKNEIFYTAGLTGQIYGRAAKGMTKRGNVVDFRIVRSENFQPLLKNEKNFRPIRFTSFPLFGSPFASH